MVCAVVPGVGEGISETHWKGRETWLNPSLSQYFSPHLLHPVTNVN